MQPSDANPIPVKTGTQRRRNSLQNRELERANARTLAQEVHIEAEPEMPKPNNLFGGGSPRLRPAKKRVHSIDDLRRFLESSSAREFIGFILSLGESVKGIKMTDEVEVSPPVQRIIDCLTQLSSWIDEIPPLEQTMRYGNVAFRDWHDRLEFSNRLVEGTPRSHYWKWFVHKKWRGVEILGDEYRVTALELFPYLQDSFGNKSRIDYGTGHETNFFAFLFCLAKLGLVGENDRQALVTRVAKSYLDLMRKLQETYGLEPAGSHGVWGLDDYQFLPFLLGSAQLINHPTLLPANITNDDIVHTNETHFMYFGCVSFVRKMKKGPLPETSPYLHDTSKLPTWTKVYAGLIKMYQGEVLCKFPIMQHFLFGRFITFPE